MEHSETPLTYPHNVGLAIDWPAINKPDYRIAGYLVTFLNGDPYGFSGRELNVVARRLEPYADRWVPLTGPRGFPLDFDAPDMATRLRPMQWVVDEHILDDLMGYKPPEMIRRIAMAAISADIRAFWVDVWREHDRLDAGGGHTRLFAEWANLVHDDFWGFRAFYMQRDFMDDLRIQEGALGDLAAFRRYREKKVELRWLSLQKYGEWVSSNPRPDELIAADVPIPNFRDLILRR